MPVTVKGRKGDTVVDEDEGDPPGTTAESSPRPSCGRRRRRHPHRRQRPGVNDGAGALVLASEEWAEANGSKTRWRPSSVTARSVTSTPASPRPRLSPQRRRWTGSARPRPTSTSGKVNEAFASVTLNTIKMFDIDPKR